MGNLPCGLFFLGAVARAQNAASKMCASRRFRAPLCVRGVLVVLQHPCLSRGVPALSLSLQQGVCLPVLGCWVPQGLLFFGFLNGRRPTECSGGSAGDILQMFSTVHGFASCRHEQNFMW